MSPIAPIASGCHYFLVQPPTYPLKQNHKIPIRSGADKYIKLEVIPRNPWGPGLLGQPWLSTLHVRICP